MDIPPSEVHGLGTPWGRVPAWHSSTQSAKEKERFRWGAGSPSVLTRPGGSHALLDLGRAVRDLREANHGDRVVGLDLAAVDLLEEVHHLVEPAELGVVVLDVARGQLGYALDLDRVDHGLEDLLAWRVLEADGDQDDLALVGEPLGRVIERDPESLLDLVVVVLEVARQIAEQEEGHDLPHPLPTAHVPVRHVAELLHQLGVQAGLLAHLALGRLRGRLVAEGVAFREREDLVPDPDHRHERPSLHLPQHHAPCGELADHSSSLTSGTKRTAVTVSSSPSRSRTRYSRRPRATGPTSAAPGSSCSTSACGSSSWAVAVTEIPPNGA